MNDIRITIKKVQIQGLDCYKPVLHIWENGKKSYSFTPQGDPLVTRRDAQKYGELHRRDILLTNN